MTAEEKIEKIKAVLHDISTDDMTTAENSIWNVINDISDKYSETDFSNSQIILEYGHIMDNCYDWNEFCNDVGLNPWFLSEGLGYRDDLCKITIEQAKKHGLLKN